MITAPLPVEPVLPLLAVVELDAPAGERKTMEASVPRAMAATATTALG